MTGFYKCKGLQKEDNLYEVLKAHAEGEGAGNASFSI
jgi:hypothetical protein